MKKPVNRKAMIISALLTALILAGVGTAVFAADRLSAAQNSQRTMGLPLVQLPATTTDASALTPNQAMAEVTAYKTQLAQAYQALDEAYAQINALQAAQSQPPTQSFRGEREHARNNASVFQEKHGND